MDLGPPAPLLGSAQYPNFNYSGLAGWQGNSTQDGFHAVPIFRVQMQLAHNLNVLVGTLHGKSNHGLITPLYNDELNLSAEAETGVQVLWHARPFTLDAWVNGKVVIFHNDKGQESYILASARAFVPRVAVPVCSATFRCKPCFSTGAAKSTPKPPTAWSKRGSMPQPA